jgi:hypothetical protein
MMRTAAPELLRYTIGGISRSVLPELTSPYALAQMRYAFSLLDTIAAEADGAADRLVRENDAVQTFLRTAHAAASGTDAAAPLHALLATLADGASLPAATDIKISTLAGRNDALWAAATPVIELLGEYDGEPWTDALRAAARPLLRAYVAARRYPPGV